MQHPGVADLCDPDQKAPAWLVYAFYRTIFLIDGVGGDMLDTQVQQEFGYNSQIDRNKAGDVE